MDLGITCGRINRGSAAQISWRAHAGPRLVLAAILVFSAGISLCQDQSQAAPAASPGQPTTVRGVVRNVASGDPLPRALVRIEGDASTGVLTDGDGRFEISDLPSGPQLFEVIKPGFLDAAARVGDSQQWGNPHDYAHNVIVVENMPELTFNMTPVNSIRGQIQLSTGDTAQGISVMLLRRSIQDGRSVWQISANAKTGSDGVYRFGELPDGLYEVYTAPTMDSEAATNLVENGSGATVARQGYASVFYPDARDTATAAKIRLAGGDQAQANITLTLEPFWSVTASVSVPRANRAGDQNVSVQVLDAQGHQVPYDTQYDAQTHTVQALVPDGTYRLLAFLMSNVVNLSLRNDGALAVNANEARSVTGEVTFAVAGHAVSDLKLPMSTMRSSPIQVSLMRSASAAAQSGDAKVFVTLSQAGGWMTDGMVNNFAEGSVDRPLEGTPPMPGTYWVHTSITSKELCEASFSAGGSNLAQEPLVLSESGSSAPLVLALRDDCARLTLSLPSSIGVSAGEELFWTVYAVPDAGATTDIEPQTLRPSTGGRVTLNGLTPGGYHIYTFDHPVSLEYRNPAVLAALPSQTITLSPGAEAEISVEAHQP